MAELVSPEDLHRVSMTATYPLRTPEDGGTSPILTEVEKQRVISKRIQYIIAGAKPLISISDSEMHRQDVSEIARREFDEGLLMSKFFLVRYDPVTNKKYRVALESLRQI